MIKATDIHEINPSYDIEPLDLRCEKKAVCETNPLYLDNLEPLDLRIFPKSNLNNTNSINCNQLLNESTNKDITISNSSQISSFNTQSNLLAENQQKRKIDTLYPKLIDFNKINKEEKYNSFISENNSNYIENNKSNDFLYYNKIDIIEKNTNIINEETIINNINIDKTNITSQPQTSFQITTELISEKQNEDNTVIINSKTESERKYSLYDLVDFIDSNRLNEILIRKSNNIDLNTSIHKLKCNNIISTKKQSSSINNHIEPSNSNEEVIYYSINFNNKITGFKKIKPSLVYMNEINNNFSVNIISEDMIELYFSFNNVFFKILLNSNKLSPFLIDFSDINDSIKIIKKGTLKKKNNFFLKNYFKIYFNKKSNNIIDNDKSFYNSSLNIKYLEISNDLNTKNSCNIIKGNFFIMKDFFDYKSFFYKRFINYNLKEGINKLFNSNFQIYDIQDILPKKYFVLYNMNLVPIINEKMKIKKFYKEFNKNKNIFKNYKLPKNHLSISDIPECSFTNINSSPKISVPGSIRLISDYFILFFNSIKEIKKILSDQKNNNNNEEIKLKLETILSHLKRNWRIQNQSMFKNKKLKEYRNMISMFVFFSNNVSGILKYWIDNKLTENL